MGQRTDRQTNKQINRDGCIVVIVSMLIQLDTV